MKLFDVLLGQDQARPAQPRPPLRPAGRPDHPRGLARPAPDAARRASASSPATGQDFAETAAEVEQLLDLGEGAKIHEESDSYGYRWVVIADDDFGDLINEVHVVNTTLEDHGWGPQLLCSVFGFAPIPGGAADPAAGDGRARRWRGPTSSTSTSGAPSTPSSRCRAPRSATPTASAS